MTALIRQALGVDIPDSPAFSLALVVHVAAGLTCIVTGVVAMTARKRPGRHPRFGSIYHVALGVVFVTATVMASIRWSQDAYLFFIGAFAFASASLGRVARNHTWRSWPYVHVPGMGISYIALLTAFYVDNGPHLPLWNRLPTIAFWVLPSLIGVPLIVRALMSPQVIALVALSRRRPGASQL
jgi:hypothetical protein